MDSTRRSFIGKTVATLAASSGVNSLAAQATGAGGEGQEFFLRLLKSSNEAVGRTLKEAQASPQPRAGRGGGRGAGGGRGGNVAALVAAYCAPESAYYKSESLIPLMEDATRAFVAAQNPDGTMHTEGGNLDSPPDTGFVIEAMGASLAVLRQIEDARLAQTKESLSKFLLAAGEALVTGGVHTPNHRWVVCHALARINSLFPAAKYVNRIDDWLGEGIYQDADGLFPERSPNYARVEVNAFVAMARLLNRPQLLEPVRKHLDANLHLMQPDGEIETVASRRQDAGRPVQVANFYLQYRYMAIRDNNPTYAAVARLIADRRGEGLVEGGNPVIHFMEEPLLKKPLPAGGAIPSDFVKIFTNSHQVRIRRGNIAATIYGGSDWPLGVASGLASDPTFFSFRKGRAILDSVRMGGQFFSEGVFRSEGLQANGNQYTLHQRFDVPYYQPLPKNLRNPRGDYPLTPARDFRFWSKLDFPHRQMGNIQTLDQKVTVVEKQGAFELHFEITGHDHVPFTVELAFRPGGEVGGSLQEVAARAGDKVFLLKEGLGRYRVGDDVIEFGPGQAEHQSLNLSGPSYAAHGATLRAAGTCVYITGYTPFRNIITIKGV
ncbi:MAG: hypothetical protein ABSH44_12035 [Bryobacteraceae bacterium]|jgi:hypothetical protein